LVLAAVRRLARGMARRGGAGRKRQRGRPRKAQQAARQRRGPTNKEKAGFILKHRFLIVKKTSELDKQQWGDLVQMFDYLPELRTLWHFACEVRGLFEKEARVQPLWRRRAALLRKEKYKEVPELAEALGMLEAGRFKKMVAFTSSAAGKRVRTNNHAERLNRRLRFWEKLRYKWRRRKWVLRFVLLAWDRWWRQAARAQTQADQAARGKQGQPSPTSKAAG
jgi:Transposase/AT hook motif